VGEFTDDGTPGQGHLPLLAGSQAINAGDPEVCAEDPQLATDQLGQPRVGICDIGAIEFQALVGDMIPPAVTMAVSPTTLWPPNGKLVSVQVSGTITDEADGSGVNASSAAFVVLDEYGEIQPHGKLTLGTDGQYAFTVALKASRKGADQDGRHYTITVSATDQAGNLGEASTTVTVPHDQRQYSKGSLRPSTRRYRVSEGPTLATGITLGDTVAAGVMLCDIHDAHTWPRPPVHGWGISPTHLNPFSARCLPLAIMPKFLKYKTRIWAMMLKNFRISSPNGR
jgi:hypothetical protein